MQPATTSLHIEPDLLSVSEFCRAIGVGRTTAYELIAAQEVVPIRIGRRTLIPRSEKDALIANRLAAAKADT